MLLDHSNHLLTRQTCCQEGYLSSTDMTWSVWPGHQFRGQTFASYYTTAQTQPETTSKRQALNRKLGSVISTAYWELWGIFQCFCWVQHWKGRKPGAWESSQIHTCTTASQQCLSNLLCHHSSISDQNWNVSKARYIKALTARYPC